MEKLINITGKALSGEWGIDDKEGIGIPVLRTTNFTNDGIVDYSNVITRTIAKKNITDKFLRKGDIIIEKSGGSDNQPVGRVVYFDNDENKYLFNNFTGLLRVKDTTKWLPKYIFYSLFANYQSGGTRRYENKTTGLHNLQTDFYVKDFEIKEISYSEQIEICELFDKITYLIDKRKRQLEKLDELVKSRFIEMFGNPNSNEKGWTVSTLGEYMTLLTDFSANGSYELLDSNVVMYDEPNYAVMVRTTDLEAGNLTDGVKYIDQTAYELLSKSKLYGGELIMNKIGSAGKIYIMPQIDKPASLGRNAFMFRFDDRINMVYLYALLSSDYEIKEIQQYVRGAVTKTITKESTRSIRVIVPPIELQEQYATFVKQTDKSKLKVQKSLEKLELLKKALMKKYFH